MLSQAGKIVSKSIEEAFIGCLYRLVRAFNNIDMIFVMDMEPANSFIPAWLLHL